MSIWKLEKAYSFILLLTVTFYLSRLSEDTARLWVESQLVDWLAPDQTCSLPQRRAARDPAAIDEQHLDDFIRVWSVATNHRIASYPNVLLAIR